VLKVVQQPSYLGWKPYQDEKLCTEHFEEFIAQEVRIDILLLENKLEAIDGSKDDPTSSHTPGLLSMNQ
jgi:hypothetical protein